MKNTAQVIQADFSKQKPLEKQNTGDKPMDMGDRLRWAWSQKTGRASSKSVLVALAEHANKDLLAWPSIAHLVELTEANRKTIINALCHLQESGFISDSGERKGRTGQVIVYKVQAETKKSPKNGTGVTVPKEGHLQAKNKPKSTDFTRKESQKRDTEPFFNPKEKDITPLTPQSKFPHMPLEEVNIEGLLMAMPLQRHWLQDERIKQIFRKVLGEYDVKPTAVIWNLISKGFAAHWEEKGTRKRNWLAMFETWTRTDVDRNAWRWKKDQQTSGISTPPAEKIEYFKAPEKPSADLIGKFSADMEDLLK